MNDPKKIFTFFGSDIKKFNILKTYSEKGYSLLPLDTSAISLFQKSEIPYRTIDDYIESKERCVAIEKAEICEKNWFESARNEFTYDGICWPDLDRRAMHLFWADICLAHTLGSCFKKNSIQKLIFPECPYPPVQIYYNHSHTCKNFWMKDLSSITSTLPTSKFLKTAQYGYKKIIHTIHLIKKPNTYTIPHSLFNNKIILVINPCEAVRFNEIVNSLKHNFKDQFLVISLSTDVQEVKKMSLEWSIPVFCEPPIKNVNYNLKNIFLKGYQKCLEESNNSFWKKPLEHLDTHFKYYCERRWPELIAKYESWLNFWQLACPDVVIVSSLADSESQIPAEAAKKMGILTFSIPHGGGVDPDNIASSEYILYSLKTQQIAWKQGGIENHRLIPCRGLLSENEYPALSSSPIHTTLFGKILVLTHPVSIPDLLPDTSIEAQFEGFQTLVHSPKDQIFDIKIKVHPAWPEIELIKMANENLYSKIIPVNYPLKSALQWADLVVDLNSASTAILHAIRERKAVIFFYSDKKFSENGNSWGKVANTRMDAGILVHDRFQFWDIVQQFFSDPDIRQNMYNRSSKYAHDYLDDTPYPRIDEIIKELLGKQKTRI